MHRSSRPAPWVATLLAAALLLGPTASRTASSEEIAPGETKWGKTALVACPEAVAEMLPYKVVEDRQTAVRLDPVSGRVEFDHTSRARDGLAQELRIAYTCSFAPQNGTPVLIDIAVHYL